MNIFVFSPVGNLLLAAFIWFTAFFVIGYLLSEVIAPAVKRLIFGKRKARKH